LSCSTAAAQSTSWHGTVSGDVAVTDNVFAAPSGDRDGDLFFQLRPGFLFAYNARRMMHDLSIDAEIVHYAFNSRIPSVSGRGGWRGMFLPGPRSQVMTQLNAGSGLLTALSSRLSADETMINLSPASQVSYMSADGSEYLSYTLTPELRLSQSLFGRWNRSEDNADEIDPMTMSTTSESAEAGMTLAIDRDFESNALSVEVGATVLRLERIAPMNAAMGSRLDRQLNPRGRAQWRHDIDRRLSFGVDGGLVLVFPFGEDPYNPGEERRSGIFPIMGAQFALTEVWGRATMMIRRDVTPSMFLAQNTVNDSATLSAALPLPWLAGSRRAPRLVGVGSVGIQRTQLINSVTSDTESSIGAARLDLSALYAPKAGVTYGLRYELQYQTGDDRAVMAVQGFFRNTIYFTFSLRYPDDVAVSLPRRRTGNSARADRQDLAPVGAEPVVPDLVEGGGEEDDE